VKEERESKEARLKREDQRKFDFDF